MWTCFPISPLGNVKHYTSSLKRVVITRNNIKNQLCLQTKRLKQEDSAQYYCAFSMAPQWTIEKTKEKALWWAEQEENLQIQSVIFLQLSLRIPGLHFLPDQLWDFPLSPMWNTTSSFCSFELSSFFNFQITACRAGWAKGWKRDSKESVLSDFSRSPIGRRIVLNNNWVVKRV